MRILIFDTFFLGADFGLIIACCSFGDMEKLRTITWIFRRCGQGARHDARKREEAAC